LDVGDSEGDRGAALVTGGAQGIGAAICVALARDGFRVVSGDRQYPSSARLRPARTRGYEILETALDICSSAEVEDVVSLVERRVGPIEILVNNAGAIDVEPLLEATDESFDRIFAVNCFGTLRCSRAAARRMVERAGGRIVNVASIAGKEGRPLFAAYAASKAAVINLTQSFALALAPYNVTVNAVCPGIVPTAMWETLDERLAALEGLERGAALEKRIRSIPLGREERPEDVAELVSFLSSERASYLTGQSINVDGGLTFH
jgi:meso-butanediol dehydrogenase/(S,S)-butanediol dehydrogenase/diacetyl reductase